MNDEPVIRCVGVGHTYDAGTERVEALRDVSLRIPQGRRVAIVGPSGSGKSTLLWMLAGLIEPSAGRITVLGHDLAALSPRETDRLRATQLGVVMQQPATNLLGYATAAENIGFALPRATRRQRRDRVGRLLVSVGLDGFAHRVAGRMSGGEQQRLAVAVALAPAPRVLLADEPTSRLDTESAERLVVLLRSLADDEHAGVTLVVTTHDPRVSDELDVAVSLRDGRLVDEVDR